MCLESYPSPNLWLPWLRPIWQASDHACGRRLVAMRPEWIPACEQHEATWDVGRRAEAARSNLGQGEAGGLVSGGPDLADLPLRFSVACLRTYSICPLTLRSSSCAQASSSAQSAGSIRNRNAFRDAIEPVQA